jgi:hypothetical protein
VFSSADIPNLLTAKAESKSNCRVGQSILDHLPDVPDVIHGDFTSAVSLSLGCPAFGDHIAVIVKDGSQKEVLRVDAAAVVATMKHAQTVGDGAVRKLPRYAMRLQPSALNRSQLPVAVRERASPEPTRRGRVNTAPEAAHLSRSKLGVHRDSFSVKVPSRGRLSTPPGIFIVPTGKAGLIGE